MPIKVTLWLIVKITLWLIVKITPWLIVKIKLIINRERMKFCSVSLKWVFLTSVVRLGGALHSLELTNKIHFIDFDFITMSIIELIRNNISVSLSMYHYQCITINASLSMYRYQCITNISLSMYQCITINVSLAMYHYQCIAINVSMYHYQCINVSLSMYHYQCITINVSLSMYH